VVCSAVRSPRLQGSTVLRLTDRPGLRFLLQGQGQYGSGGDQGTYGSSGNETGGGGGFGGSSGQDEV
jgi:hypothetical protein